MPSKKSIIYYNIGKSLLEEGKIKEALEAFEIAIFEEPGFHKAREAYDSALAEMEPGSSMADRLRSQVEEQLVGQGARANLYLGKLYYFDGDYLSALDELAIALQEAEAESDQELAVEVLNLMGSVYYAREEFELLAEYAGKALELDDKSAGAWFNRGLWLKTAEMFPEAKEAFGQAISYNRQLFHAYDELGELHITEGDLEKAEELFSKILEIIPDWLNSYFALGEIALRKGDTSRSLKQFKKALAILPNDQRLLSKLGKVYNMAGDPANAILCLEKLLKSGTASDEDLMNLAVAHLLLLMPGTALKVLAKLRDIQPGHPMLSELTMLGNMMEQLTGRLQELPASLREELGLGSELVLRQNARGKGRAILLPFSSQTTILDFSRGTGQTENEYSGGRVEERPEQAARELFKELMDRPEEGIAVILSRLRARQAVSTLTSPGAKEQLMPKWPEKKMDRSLIDTVSSTWRELARELRKGAMKKLPNINRTKKLMVLHKEDVRLDYFLEPEILVDYRKDKRKKWVDLTLEELEKGLPLKKAHLLALFPEFFKP